MTLHRGLFLAIDLCFVAFATVIALLLRDNFEINLERLLALAAVYLPISLAIASGVFAISGLDRGLWCHSSIVDYLHVVILTIIVVLLSVGLTFAINRLEGIPRSLPILQSMLIVGTLVSARVIVRLSFERRGISRSMAGTRANSAQTILIVGTNTISGLFLRSMREYAPHHRVAGVLAVDPTVRGRTIQRNKVLGTVEDLHGILESLHVHGVAVDRIVVTIPRQRLSKRALEVLEKVERSSDIVVHVLPEQLGFGNCWQHCLDFDRDDTARESDQHQSTRRHDSIQATRSGYWKLKRIIDCCVSVLLMMFLVPVSALIATAVVLDVGFPLIFWQQRPGLHGRPFRLYKFRTMRAAHDEHFKRVRDECRLSLVGRFLRQLRLDEIPQLYNVLIGDMSLIGPRPLLPHDQSPTFAARLSVRPGLTGWAQVNGGRIISATDKAILDIWYVNKASFLLDLRIIFRTVRMIFFGDRINAEAVWQARQDLGQPAGWINIVRSEEHDRGLGAATT